MKQLLELLRDLTLLRRGPQDVPYSNNLLVAVALGALLLDLVVATRFQAFAAVAPRVALSLGVLFALPYVALRLAKLEARYAQTVIALVATSAVFTILSIPIVLGVGKLPDDPGDLTPVQGLLAWVSLLLVGWQLAVRGNIMRHALNLPMRLGVLIAVVFFAVELMLTLLVFGREATP